MASHDLQFEVHNGDNRNVLERPRSGEMDHLPDNRSSQQTGGTVQYLSDKLKQSSHPTVIIFHILFKAAAIVLYVMGGLIAGNSSDGARMITLVVLIILLHAADFWTVKNITGRLLVGLRWWNKVEEDETTWIFESAEDKMVNKFDRTVFWTVLYGTPLVWCVFLFLAIISFKVDWLLVNVIAIALNFSNVYGYYKCSKEQKTQLQSLMQNTAQQGAMAMMRSNVMNVLAGTNSNASSNIV